MSPTRTHSWKEKRSGFCVLRLGVRPVGAIALCGTEMGELNARALASLCAIALERARALDKLYHAEADREAEKLRTAVLDALAHKFKTPLTVIRTAVAGVSRIRGTFRCPNGIGQSDRSGSTETERSGPSPLSGRRVSIPGSLKHSPTCASFQTYEGCG